MSINGVKRKCVHDIMDELKIWDKKPEEPEEKEIEIRYVIRTYILLSHFI